MALLHVQKLQKVYTTRFRGNKVQALSDVSFSADSGEYMAIMGESGSGKTTLLNILAALDKPSGGNVLLNEEDISQIPEKHLSKFRRNHLGFVFQDFNLLDTFSIKDNIFLPLVLSGKKHQEMEERLAPIVKKLNIRNILDKFPYEVSGGQMQRTAVARALIADPELVLADEPTGALDSKTSKELLNHFEQINKEGQTILMVTHSIEAACYAKRVLFIKDGRVFQELHKGERSKDEMFLEISNTLAVMSAGSGNNE